MGSGCLAGCDIWGLSRWENKQIKHFISQQWQLSFLTGAWNCLFGGSNELRTHVHTRDSLRAISTECLYPLLRFLKPIGTGLFQPPRYVTGHINTQRYPPCTTEKSTWFDIALGLMINGPTVGCVTLLVVFTTAAVFCCPPRHNEWENPSLRALSSLIWLNEKQFCLTEDEDGKTWVMTGEVVSRWMILCFRLGYYTLNYMAAESLGCDITHSIKWSFDFRDGSFFLFFWCACSLR